MRVNHVRLIFAARAHGGAKLGAKEPEQREAGAPRVADLLRHVARVGERLITSRRVVEARDAGSVDASLLEDAGTGWRDDADVDV